MSEQPKVAPAPVATTITAGGLLVAGIVTGLQEPVSLALAGLGALLIAATGHYMYRLETGRSK